MPVRLVIPGLKIDVPVTEMTRRVIKTAAGSESEWIIPENAGGHASNSALLGERGNVVISGHNNIYGRVFMSISTAWPLVGSQKVDGYTDRSDTLNGQKIQVLDPSGRSFDYVVSAFYRVRDSGVPPAQRLANARFIRPTEEAQLTLTTCWPPWSNSYRLIVVAQPAGNAS